MSLSFFDRVVSVAAALLIAAGLVAASAASALPLTVA